MRALVTFVVLLLAGPVVADPVVSAPCPAPVEAHKLVVGTIPIAPFIIKRADGTWGGISIDLWKEVARRAGLDYEIRELAMSDFTNDATMASLDAFVSLNVSAKSEAKLDLTHAFYSTGLAIAVAPKSSDGLGRRCRRSSRRSSGS